VINQSPLLLKFHKRWDIAMLLKHAVFACLPRLVLGATSREVTDAGFSGS